MTEVSGRSERLRMRVAPGTALVDEPFEVRVDAAVGSDVRITATMFDGAGQRWSSEATYIADPTGAVTTRRDAPIGGSYRTADTSGLLWSMSPAGDEGVSGTTRDDTAPFDITITASSNDATVPTTARRIVLADEVDARPIDGSRCVGEAHPFRRTDPHRADRRPRARGLGR